MPEPLSFARTLVVIRTLATRCPPIALAEPLAAARDFIERSPRREQAEILARIAEALRKGDGRFDAAELEMLGADALVIADALVEQRLAGGRIKV